MPKPEKSEFVKIDPGCYFLSLTVSGYHIKTISKSFGHSKKNNFRFSALGLSRSTDFRSESGVKSINNRKPLKSYTNPPKIIGLIPILNEQFKFYVPQHGRALVPCRLVWGQSDLIIGFPVHKLVYPPMFRSIRLQLLEKLLFQFQC